MTTTTYEGPLVRPTLGGRLRALPKRALLIAGAAIALALAGAWWIASPPTAVSTDDAYLKADSTIIAPKIHGLVLAILVRDNQHVRAGQPLVQIDPEEYQQDVTSASADVASAAASLAQLGAQEALAAANARAAEAAIRSADAERSRAAADRTRYETLASSGDISRQLADTARATSLTADADADKARAAYVAANEQFAVVQQTQGQLVAALNKARAAFSLAQQDLGHTIIRSPVDGVVGDRQVQMGEYVQPGTQLLTIVPLNTIYIVANFKETQTTRMLAGQRAEISIDVLNGETLNGTVESFAPGSGSEFSLLPFEPATGNFTRIVQRVPVRIHFDPNQPSVLRLRPGLSADVTVRLK